VFADTPKQCLAGKAETLKHEGFSGVVICDEHKAIFKLIGQITSSKHSFLIYDYRYKFKPSQGAVLHGGQRIVIFNVIGRYVGQYALTPPPYSELQIENMHLTVTKDGVKTGEIDFSSGAPKEAYVDGDTIALYK
jgi:hypothetical protein